VVLSAVVATLPVVSTIPVVLAPLVAASEPDVLAPLVVLVALVVLALPVVFRLAPEVPVTCVPSLVGAAFLPEQEAQTADSSESQTVTLPWKDRVRL